MKSILQKIYQIASGEIGVREVGENEGKRVGQYQAATTLGGTGWPWCAAFVAWVLREAEKSLGIKLPWCDSASCDIISDWAKRNKILYNSPEPGDVFLSYASDTDAVHTGLVTGVSGASFNTIEGNTNLNGSREGIGVFSRTRQNATRYKFVRWMDLIPNETIEKLGETTVKAKPWTLLINGKNRSLTVHNAITRDNHIMAWVRDFEAATGLPVVWNNDEQVALIGGVEIPAPLTIIEVDGVNRSYYPLRALATATGMNIKLNPVDRNVTIF